MNDRKKISVIGAGSWGTAIAHLFAKNDNEVKLWALEDEVARSINEDHHNVLYLKDNLLSNNIHASTSFEKVLDDCDAVAIVTPSNFFRETIRSCKEFVNHSALPFLICSKGMEAGTGLLLSEVLEQEIGNSNRIAVLSGPTHAEEVIKDIPTAVTCACENDDIAIMFRNLLSSRSFRVYTSNDVAGVELCAAFKNVIAIAVGIAYGMGYGDNTAAMIITRGVAEMTRAVCSIRGDIHTCTGLAGIGDMVVTCMSRHSRNRRFGEDYLARGKGIEEFSADTHMVVEGIYSCKNLRTLAEKNKLDLPITDTIYKIIWENENIDSSIFNLSSRPLKPEF